jgi:hypothetical protein
MSLSPRSPIGSLSVGGLQDERSAPGRDLLPFRAPTSHRRMVVLFRCSPALGLIPSWSKMPVAHRPVRDAPAYRVYVRKPSKNRTEDFRHYELRPGFRPWINPGDLRPAACSRLGRRVAPSLGQCGERA